MKPYTNLTAVIQYIIANNDMLYVSHDLWVWSVLKYNGVKKKGHRTQCPLQKGNFKKEKDEQQTVFTYCITQQGCYFNCTVEPQDLNYTTFLNKQKINKKNRYISTNSFLQQLIVAHF